MNEESTFAAALEKKTPQEREVFLEGICAANPELCAKVESLLRAHDDAGDFLGAPAFEAPMTATMDTKELTERPGTDIGPYKLLQQIGEGGFGVVYMAEQREPVRRKVALKIIKPGMDTKEVIARFEAERQALAMMDHPNIARVFDAGATKTGRPYFVMELVRGVPLVDFCDENNLNTQQRLGLCIAVCRAIQHAHQKGIIHRDLKPSNVMVTLHDNKPVPKVIDFGVSKAISQQLTERTLFTAYGQMVGTPVYMSPEQAQMSGLDVDTRSDIYSLGVMLFELLTGSTPLDAERLRKSGYEEMQRLIREEEAPRPSHRLSTQSGEALAKTAKNRGTDPSQLGKQLRGELDWIVMKALEKDRTRRYETANGFANDLCRYLGDEPVEACPPSATYRLKKFARRNKVLISTLTVVALALLLGIAGTSWQSIRATKAEDHARQLLVAEQQAHEEADLARKAEAQQRVVAEQERDRAEAAGRMKDESLTDVYTALGLSAATSERNPEARLWFANAAKLAPDEPRARFNRIRARSWANNMLVPTAVLPHSAEWIGEIQVYADGQYVMTRVLGPDHDRETVDLGDITIWDAKNSTIIQMPDQLIAPRAARWSPDGSWLAVINSNGELYEVAFPSMRIRSKLTTDIKALRLRFSPSGRYLGMFGSREARVWDCREQKYVTPPLRHPNFVAHLRFSSEEDRIVTACLDDLARVFAVSQESREPLFEPVKHRVSLDSAVIQSLGNPAVLGGRRLFTILKNSLLGRDVVCWNAQSGDEIARWPATNCIVATDGARAVVSASPEGSGFLIDSDSLDLRRLGTDYQGIPAVEPSNDWLVLAKRGSLRICSFSNLKTIAQSVAISRTPSQIEISPDGSCFVTAERGGLVKVWRLIQRNPGVYRLRCGSSFADVSDDGKYFLPIGLSQRSSRLTVTRVHEVETGRPASKPFRPGGVLIDGKFSPNEGDHLALATSAGSPTSRREKPGQQSGELSIWDWRRGSRICVYSLEVEARSLDFSPDGHRIAVLSADGTVVVLDALTGEQALKPWGAHPPYTQNNWFINNGEIAYSPDGSCIITWGADNYARFWHADSSDRLGYKLNHDGRVFDVAFSSDGMRFVTAEWGGDRVQVWDFESGKRVGAPMEHPSWPMRVRFSGDGTRIVSGCIDRAARVWDWQTGKLVCPPMGHPDQVHAVTFLPELDGQLILTGCADKTARVWECLTGKPVTPPMPIQGRGLTVSLTPNGSHAVIGGNGSTGLSVLCLEEILSDDTQSTEDLAAMAEFFSGHRIAKGGLQRLTEPEVIESYEKLRSKVQSEVGRRGYDAPQVAALVPNGSSWATFVDRLFSAAARPRSLSPTEEFTEHDVDGNGAVTEDEVGEDYWKTIAAFDTNGDGTVHREEHQAGLRKASVATRRRLFSRADRDPADGQISSNEAGSLWEKWKRYDGNGDNMLNEVEFLKATEPNKEQSDEN